MLNTIQIKVVFDRKHVATKAHAVKPAVGLVQLAVTINRRRQFVSTSVRVHSDQFSAGRIVNRDDSPELNARIDNCIKAVIDLVNQCDAKNQRFAPVMLESLFFSSSRNTSWTDWMEEQIRKRSIAEGTRRHQLIVLEYLKKKGYTDKAQMTVETILAIDNDLKNRDVGDRKMLTTSIYDYHKVIRCYIRMAVQMGYLEQNPYDHVKIERGRYRPRQVLTMEELERVANLKTLNRYIAHVRDLFLTQCYTGLSFCDMCTADFAHAEGDILKGFRGKTKVAYTTVITEPVRKILRRNGGKLPLMAYDDYRRMIVPMLQMCGIEKTLSTHNARHTFATTVALANGVPIEVLSKMLGHTDIKTTQIYAKVQDSMIQEQAERLASVIDF